MTPLLSPVSGLPLRPEGPDVLTDGSERWPVLDGIPYLRTGRAALVAAALARIDAGESDAALALLLADADDWWDGPAPEPADLGRLIRDRDELGLGEAMALLAYGRVGDYFAHRWSDPTFLAGLALLDAHWGEPASAFELACGIGHFLRELGSRGVRVAGGDVVFSKLWLARHWVVGPEPDLVCFDARRPWPMTGRRYDLVLCQDAFYFLEPKDDILRQLRGLAAGQLAVGHVHNREAANHSAGHGMSVHEVERLFPGALVYDDAELTRAAGEGRAPVPAAPAGLRHADAFGLVEGASGPARPADGPLCRPRPPLRRNPLYRPATDGTGSAIAWPSERYRAEYEALATYPARTELPDRPDTWTAGQARRREVVSLPERW